MGPTGPLLSRATARSNVAKVGAIADPRRRGTLRSDIGAAELAEHGAGRLAGTAPWSYRAQTLAAAVRLKQREAVTELARRGHRLVDADWSIEVTSPAEQLWREDAMDALGPGDIAIGISHTGTTIDTIDALRAARRRGATTGSNYVSPIAAVSELLLTTAARETTFGAGAMSSRIAPFALVDCLLAGVAPPSYDQAIEALHSTHEMVQSRLAQV